MRLSLAVVAALCVVTVAARADTVYTYTGANYTGVTGAYTTSERVTGTITLASPLAANLRVVNITPSSFFFNDGVDTYTPGTSNAGFTFFQFSTDASGAITGFDFQIYQGGVPATLAGQINVTGYNSLTRVRAFDPPLSTAGVDAGGSFSSGVSTVAAVTPEPSSLALLGTGVLGAFGLLKRRLT